MAIVPDFVFDVSVASAFSDMIQRSVPGYSTVVAICGTLAERFSQPNTRLYDLGCSLGATSFVMAKQAAAGCEVVAVDNSEAMLEGIRAKINVQAKIDNAVKIFPQCEDIQNIKVDNASVVALNYTLQFIAKQQRTDLLKKIYQGMTQGAVLILSEKICFEDKAVDDLYVELHHEFKSSNGYSELEISQKRDAIDNVLLPETLAIHKQRLEDCGFSRIEVWFQCFNFVSLIAFK